MKNTLNFSLLILFIAVSCTQEKKQPLEGGWKLVSASYPDNDMSYPGTFTGSGVKTWVSGTFVFAGSYRMDTVVYDNYGWGTNTLTEGNKYEEVIMYHHLSESLTGSKIKMIIEVKNDTLFQYWPADDDWKLPGKYSIEKYVRLK